MREQEALRDVEETPLIYQVERDPLRKVRDFYVSLFHGDRIANQEAQFRTPLGSKS